MTITRSNQFPNVGLGPWRDAACVSPGIPGVFPAYSYLADALTASAPGTSTSGADTAARPKRRARICEPASGDGGLSLRLWSRMSPPRTSNCASMTWNSTFPSGPCIAAAVPATDADAGAGRRNGLAGCTAGAAIGRGSCRGNSANWNRRFSSRRTRSACCWAKIPGRSSGASRSPNSRSRTPFPPGCLRSYSSAGRIFRKSEQTLVAANADIGVARAQLFPQLSLTGDAGVESIGLHNIFKWGARTWNWTAGVSQPIFNAGSLRANVRLSEAQQQEAVLTYKQTIQTAFGEVSNSLIAFDKLRDLPAARGSPDGGGTGRITPRRDALQGRRNQLPGSADE